MTARGGGIDRRFGRPGSKGGRLAERLRPDTRAVLAVCLTAVMLLSVLAVPVAGAPPDNAKASGGSGNGNGGGNGGADAGSAGQGGSSTDSGGSGNSAGSSSGGGSSSDAGRSRQSALSGSSGNAASSGGNGGNGGNEASSGGNGGNAASTGGNSGNAASSGGNGGNSGNAADNANAGGNGNNDERGPPEQANAGGNGGGPTVSVSAGPPDDVGNGQGPPENPPGQSGDARPSSVVEVAVGGAQSGEKVTIDTSSPEVEDDPVAFDGVSVRVKRDGDFTMRVSNSEEALEGSPAFEPKEAAEALGRIRLEHSISNEEVEDVSFTFRVSKERLQSSSTDTEEVALYRFADGEWTALTTDVVGETESHYVFAAQSPGMSEFAVGAKRPAFDTYWADVEADATGTGDEVTVSGRVSNTGGADGVYEASLVVDGEVVSTRQVTIASGGTRQVNFETSFDEAGTYEVAVDDVSAGSVTVDGGSRAANLDQSLVVGFEWVMEVGRSIRTLGVWSTAGL